MPTFRIATLCLALASLAHAGDEEGPYVWTGKRGMFQRAPRVVVEVTSYGKDSPNEVRRVAPDAHANALRAELAQLRLAEATEGPSAELDAQRLELWIRACDGEPFEGQGELLVELALERAERLALRGAAEAALETTHELLLPGRVVEAAGELELQAADAAWLERAAAWLADPRLVALRAKLAPPQDAPRPSTDVDQVIEQHLVQGNVEAVLQFGARAVPVAERWIRTHPSEYRALAADDPLTVLFKLDEERGARLALELVEGSGEIFPLRVLRAMREARVLHNEGTWSFRQVLDEQVEFTRAELIQTVWRDLLESLVVQGSLAADAFTEVGLLVEMDALSPRLAESLEAAIRGDDATRRQKAVAALSQAGWRDSARPLLARLLDHPDAQVRAYMAQRLSDFDEVRELWPLAHDVAPEVRVEVLGALRPGRPRVLRVHGVGAADTVSAGRTSLRGLDRGGMAVLCDLLLDDEAPIYLGAMEIVEANFELVEVPVDTLRGLVAHPDTRMRRRLPGVRFAGVPDAIVLAELASDPDSDVRKAVDDTLRRVSIVGPHPSERTPDLGRRAFLSGSTAWDDRFLPALETRLRASERIPDGLVGPAFVAMHTSAGAECIARVALETESAEVRTALVEQFGRRENWTGFQFGWHFVEPDLARDLLARHWSQAPGTQAWSSVAEALLQKPRVYEPACLSWVDREELPWEQRLLALLVSEPLADDAWCAQLTRVLAAAPGAGVEVRSWYSAVRQLGQKLPDRELASRYLAAVVRDQDLPEGFVGPLTSGLCNLAVPSAETARLALERWGGARGGVGTVVEVALEHVVVTEQQPETALFERLLSVDDDDVVAGALRAMGRMHLSAHLPLLERALLGELGAGAEMRLVAQTGAASALACYLDDGAAELLLRGVGTTPDKAVREACFLALDTIRRYQDERARWSTRAGSEQARAEAIAELIGLIETGEGVQRIEAVRALGTLEAVEELPRLVRLTGSKDAALAKAAKETLDAIRRAQERSRD